MSPRTARLLLVAWTLLLVAILLPWTSYLDHPHWYKVAWIPFVSPPVRPHDVVLNVAAFLPLGWLCRRSFVSVVLASIAAVVLTLTLSLTAEYAQVFSHTRFPSTTDIVCNVIGTVAGLRLGRARHAAQGTGSAASV